MMSYRLAAALSDKIAAVAPVAASAVNEGPWTPARGSVFIAVSERVARMEIFDVWGRSVRVIQPDALDGRTKSFAWDGRDASGAVVPAGLYLFRLIAETGAVHHGKLIRIR